MKYDLDSQRKLFPQEIEKYGCHKEEGLVIVFMDKKVNSTICQKEQEWTFLYSIPVIIFPKLLLRASISTICQQLPRIPEPHKSYQLSLNLRSAVVGGKGGLGSNDDYHTSGYFFEEANWCLSQTQTARFLPIMFFYRRVVLRAWLLIICQTDILTTWQGLPALTSLPGRSTPPCCVYLPYPEVTCTP